jgi:outer membrane protein
MPKENSKSLQITSAHLLTFVAAVVIITFSFSFYLIKTRPKIAYVRSLELVYGFNGMKQAHAEFTNQTNIWQSNVDTLRSHYGRYSNNLELKRNTVPVAEIKAMEDTLQKMQLQLNEYVKVVQQQATEKEKKLTEGVMKQINSYVEEYSKKQGYDIVLGAEGTGSILYGTDSYDITSEVLNALNRDYKLLPARKDQATGMNY